MTEKRKILIKNLELEKVAKINLLTKYEKFSDIVELMSVHPYVKDNEELKEIIQLGFGVIEDKIADEDFDLTIIYQRLKTLKKKPIL